MNKNLLFLIVFVYAGLISFSQAPQSIPYQAVARDASGNLLQNTTICVQYRVYNAATGGTLLYEEHQQATTNKLGLFSVNIGTGGTYDGGSSATLGGINWGSNSVYVEIGLDATGGCTGSNTYTNMGRNQMMSVPFALYAASAGSASGAAGGNLTGTYPNPTIGANQVTYARIQTETNATILGNNSGSAASPSEIGLGTGLGWNGANQIINTKPDLTVAFTNGAGISVTGTYPNFTIANTSLSSGGTVTSITASAPLTGGTITSSGTIGITQAGASASGYLSSADWNTFNNKVSTASNSTQYYVPHWTTTSTGTGSLSNTSLIFDNSTSVGVGTTSPTQMLTVVDAGNTDKYSGTFGVYPLNLSQGISIGYCGISEVGTNGNNAMYLNAQGTGNLVLQNVGTGNVGVGVVSPQYSLDVASSFQVSSPTRTLTPSGGGGDVSVAGGYTYVSYTQSGTFTLPAGLSSLAVEVLVVGGGGGGGTNGGGGGGAGQIIDQSGTITGNATITVGAGGQGALGVSNNAPGLQGGTSSFSAAGFTTVTAYGGGGGATRVSSGNSTAGGGAGYGSGGGGSSVTTTPGAAGGGFAGGAGYINSGTGCYSTGGGGGGAGAAGAAAANLAPGTGGAGKTFADFPSPLGASGYFGGGGGGGVTCAEGGGTPSGGSGGGGSGSNGGSSGGNGTPGTGSGGGGGGQQGSGYNGGDGGSGIVIIRYSNSTTYTPSSSQPTIIATAGGNVGIGTSTPQYNLQVAGTFQASSIATTIYTNSATNTGHFQVTASCGPGGTLISGGCYDNADDIFSETGTTAISMSYPMSATTWRCGSRDITTAQTRTLTAYAICTQ